MLDLDERRRLTLVDEADVDLGRVGAVTAEVPQVGEPARRIPDRHLAPVVLGAVAGPLEDPSAGPSLEHDLEVRLAGDGVVGRPPLPDAGRPDLEGVGRRAGDLEGDPDRLDHRSGVVFSATSRNRPAASPQTCSR